MNDDVKTLMDRVDRLERQNGRWRLAAFLLPAVALILGAAQASNGKGKTITAEEIILTNADGKAGVTLKVSKHGGEIRVLDQNGTGRVFIAANLEDFGPLMNLYTKAGKVTYSSGQSKDNGIGYTEFYDEGQFKGGVGGNSYKK